MLWWLKSVAANDVAAIYVPHTRRFSVFGLLGAFGGVPLEAEDSPLRSQKCGPPESERWGLPYRCGLPECAAPSCLAWYAATGLLHLCASLVCWSDSQLCLCAAWGGSDGVRSANGAAAPAHC